MAENSEFKGLAKEALRNINGDIRDMRGDVKDIKKELKEYYIKNENDHLKLFTALTKLSVNKIPWKFWGPIGAALIASFTSFAIVVITVVIPLIF